MKSLEVDTLLDVESVELLQDESNMVSGAAAGKEAGSRVQDDVLEFL